MPRSDRFGWIEGDFKVVQTITTLEPECSKRGCVHFRGVVPGQQSGKERVICDAFPGQIPDEIAFGDNLHLIEFPGDQGVRFEKGAL